VEGFLTVRANYISDVLAKESIAMIRDCFEALLHFPTDPKTFPLEIRKKLLLASSIAGMGIAQSGTAAPHSMGYMFTLNWGTDHGRANGLLMTPFLKWCQAQEQANPAIPLRIPGLCAALGMDLEQFFDILEKLLGEREKASEAELQTWGNTPMKNAASTYIKPEQQDILNMFREAVG
jgi:alcohol dehydrogenase